MQRSAFRTNDSEPVRRQLAARPPLQLLSAAESARSDQFSVPLKARQRVGPTFLNFRKRLLRRGLHVLPGTFVCALHLLEELARFFGLLLHLLDGLLVLGLGLGSCLLNLLLIILDLRLPDIRLRLELLGKLLLHRHGLLLLVKFQARYKSPSSRSARPRNAHAISGTWPLSSSTGRGILRIIDRDHNKLNAALLESRLERR